MKSNAILYWLVTGIVAIAFVVPGIGNLVHAPQIAGDMARLGYPSYFLNILGTWKILGAIAIMVPGFARIKEWAYAGMIFDLTGAAISRAVSGDGVGGVVPSACDRRACDRFLGSSSTKSPGWPHGPRLRRCRSDSQLTRSPSNSPSIPEDDDEAAPRPPFRTCGLVDQPGSPGGSSSPSATVRESLRPDCLRVHDPGRGATRIGPP